MTINQLISKNSLKAVVVLTALSFFVFSCVKRNKIEATLTAEDTAPPTAEKISDKDYSKFSHSVPEHFETNCDSCHKREGSSLALNYSGHDSCISCHLNEFTNPKSGICAVCHDDLKVVPATMKTFPTRFREGFNMKFDHAAHLSETGCASCHQPQGAAQTIPSGINSHSQCFACHTSESNIGSCNYCHDLAPYQRTSASRTIFKAVFRHSDHQRSVGCTDCHTVKRGEPQSRQVAAPVAVQHFGAGGSISCRSCHNDRRAFGENDFANCKRCHGGSGFDMLP